MDNSFPTMLARDEDVEQVLTDFRDAWKRGTPVPLTQFFERLQNESPQVRESVQLLLVLHDQTLRWQMWSRQREMMGDTDASPDVPTEPSGRAPLLEVNRQKHRINQPSVRTNGATRIRRQEFKIDIDQPCFSKPCTDP